MGFKGLLSTLCVTGLLLSPVVSAQDADEPGAAPPPPDLPPKIEGETLEPEVNIREEEGRIIEEYSRNGQVYMVKVTPENGLPYYYLDADGDGSLELQGDQQGTGATRPVYWKVAEW